MSVTSITGRGLEQRDAAVGNAEVVFTITGP
jgi:hypothetical protein